MLRIPMMSATMMKSKRTPSLRTIKLVALRWNGNQMLKMVKKHEWRGRVEARWRKRMRETV